MDTYVYMVIHNIDTHYHQETKQYFLSSGQ